MTRFALGLDGGGTQTRAAVAGPDGALLGQGLAGACNLAAVSPPDALAAALAAADQALSEAGLTRADVGTLCAGVAGASFGERRLLFLEGLQTAFQRTHVAVEPDYAIALTGAAAGGPGVIVIAGTGSAAYGENTAGLSHRTGAYGYLIDDAGSGYGVGRAGLAAILRAADGTGEPTTLSERLPTVLGLASLADVVPGVYGGTISRVTLAGLSRTVADAARDDADAVARAILMRAGGALAQLAQGVTSRLFASSDLPYPLSPIGSLWDAGDALTDVFTRSLHRFAPLAVWTPPQRLPVEGALLRAIRHLVPEQKS